MKQIRGTTLISPDVAAKALSNPIGVIADNGANRSVLHQTIQTESSGASITQHLRRLTPTAGSLWADRMRFFSLTAFQQPTLYAKMFRLSR